jgi:hypothetical protein
MFVKIWGIAFLALPATSARVHSLVAAYQAIYPNAVWQYLHPQPKAQNARQKTELLDSPHQYFEHEPVQVLPVP